MKKCRKIIFTSLFRFQRFATSLFYSGSGDTRRLNNALYNVAHVANTNIGSDSCVGMLSGVLSVSYNGVVYQTLDRVGEMEVPFERGSLTLNTMVTGVTLDPDKFIF